MNVIIILDVVHCVEILKAQYFSDWIHLRHQT
jgi:hypothetical protein